MDNLIGKDVGRYHIEEQLGEGGMATVYKAYDTDLQRIVAIKFIRKDLSIQQSAISRFTREARALAKLNHPSINRVLDYGWHEDTPYFVMEYLPGGNLKESTGEPLNWKSASEIVLLLSRALAYAHENKVIHRDIKPANILMGDDGSPVISDFGISKMVEAESTSDLTTSGAIVGTPAYMSPEQGQGEPADNRSDIYSLGVVYYELLTGRTPYQADTPVAIILKQINDPLPSPRKLVSEIPVRIEQMLFKALAKDPSNRFDTMDDFVREIEEVLAVSTDPEAKRTPLSFPKFRRPWLVGIIIIAAIAIFGILLSQYAGTPGSPIPESLPPNPTIKSTPTPVKDTNRLVIEPFIDAAIIQEIQFDDLEAIETGKWTSSRSDLEVIDDVLRVSAESAETDGMIWEVRGYSINTTKLLRFRTQKTAEIALVYANDEGLWETDEYRGFWLNHFGLLYYEIIIGVENERNAILPAVQFQDDVWYYLMYRVSQQGVLSGSLWEEGATDPLWSTEIPLGAEWANQSYRLLVHALTGSIDLANFYVLDVSDEDSLREMQPIGQIELDYDFNDNDGLILQAWSGAGAGVSFLVDNHALKFEITPGEECCRLDGLLHQQNWVVQRSDMQSFSVEMDVLIHSNVQGSEGVIFPSMHLLGPGRYDIVFSYEKYQDRINFSCAVTMNLEDSRPELYYEEFGSAEFDEWHRFRISILESSATNEYIIAWYLDGEQQCLFTPPEEWQSQVRDGGRVSLFINTWWGDTWNHTDPLIVYYDNIVVGYTPEDD
ncbi:MAG: serine/threonine protein kinase [Anaerolineae bacterium]|nr:serine/threonine protein kinase [Anaerolineae bacterium]